MRLDQPLARGMARIALGHVAREYPHKLDHVLDGDGDARPPRVLHPVFFGSFDWHSCVHGWWTLLTLRRRFPDTPEAAEIVSLAEATFTAEKLAVELAYLDRPSSRGFERPYGWAWLLQLHLEATRHEAPWSERIEPLARAFAARFRDYLAILTYPIRTGTHGNSAFAVTLALDWADAFDPELAALLRDRAVAWFREDRDCQAWEPGGDEFLSGALSEALCMSRSLPAAEFAVWFADFLPRLAGPSRAAAEAAADRHLDSALPHLSGEYAGEHWLASFALLALLA